MKEHFCNLELINNRFSFYFHNEVDEELIDATVLLWESLAQNSSNQNEILSLNSTEVKVDLEFDYLSLKNHLVKYYCCDDEVQCPNIEKEGRVLRIKAHLILEDESPLDPIVVSTRAIERALVKTFFIMNLAIPGSFALKNASIKEQKYFRINLESYPLESGMVASQEHGLDLIKALSYKSVCDWFYSASLFSSPVAESSSQKVVYSLIHYLSEEPTESSIAWLAHAIESLYCTTQRSILVERITSVFPHLDNEKKLLKDMIWDFYEFRNKFFHGSLNIRNPFEDYSLINNGYWSIFDRINAHIPMLILGTLQKYVEERWVELSFKEIATGRCI